MPAARARRPRGRPPAARRATSSSCRTAVPPLSSTVARISVVPRRRSGRRTSTTLPGNASRTSRTAGVSPLSATASLPHAPRISTSSQLAPWVAVPASGSPAASDDAEHVEIELTPAACPRAAGRARDRSRARPRRRGTRRSAFAVSRPGRATARSRTFFGVCSSSTNSSDLDVVPHGPEQLGARGVRHLRGESLTQGAVPEQRLERRAFSS